MFDLFKIGKNINFHFIYIYTGERGGGGKREREKERKEKLLEHFFLRFLEGHVLSPPKFIGMMNEDHPLYKLCQD